MVRVRIFIEGGGSGATPDKTFRQAWSKFFEAAGFTGKIPRVVRGESRNETFGKFKSHLQRRPSDEITLMLVDSEGPVSTDQTPWEYLRNQDNWNQPQGAANDSAYLMVQVMETWFLADRRALREFFGSSLNDNHLKQWPDLETVPKETVISALVSATVNCQKPYSKGRVSFELLGRVDPLHVSAACPHARQLLQYLRDL